MPFALLIIGVWLLVAGVRNTAGPATSPGTLFALVHGDFVGNDNFVYWFLAILAIGVLGYVPKIKPLSTAFLALVIVVLFLNKGASNKIGGGFFQKFMTGIGVTQGASSAFGPLTPTTAAQNLSSLQTQQQQLMIQQQGALLPPLVTTN